MNRLVQLARTYEERIGTHWLGCEEHHRECLIVKLADALEQAEAERDALRALLTEVAGRGRLDASDELQDRIKAALRAGK